MVFIFSTEGDTVEQRADRFLRSPPLVVGANQIPLRSLPSARISSAVGHFRSPRVRIRKSLVPAERFPILLRIPARRVYPPVHGAVASLGALRVVARTLDVATELRESRLVIGGET